jgi:uncharacterized glyoxalase superfamily protein PhnB/dihydrofolate reductase
MAITPYLLYRDAGAALAWLTKAFGLRQSGEAHKDGDGRVTHAAMKLGDAWVMLGSPGPDFKNPKLLGQVTQNLYVDVENVDKHYALAVKAGAKIVEEPKDTVYGARRYGAEDPEGHRWYFAQEIAPNRPAGKKAKAGNASAPRGRSPAPVNDQHASDEERAMRRIRYSVAMSLDGYIAGPNGEYDWIELDPSAGATYFKAFYAQFDTVLMGRKSYEQAGGAIKPFDTYVLSRTLPTGKHGDVTVLGADALERVAALRAQAGKDIWLWGGGELFGSLAAAGLVDTVEVGVVPVLLGAGRKIMAGCDRRVKLVQRPTGLELPGHTLLAYDVENRA